MTATALDPFDFVRGLPVEALHQQLTSGNTMSTLGRRKVALGLADMQARGVFAMSGHGSAVHYARGRLHMSKRRAEEMLHIGRRLEELPEVDAALFAGELGWSKLRMILRVAAEDTQAAWLERADSLNCEELEVDVTRHQRGELPRGRNPGGLHEVFMTVRARLNLLNHELWENAKRKRSAEMKMRVTNEDMMIYCARLILSTDAEGKVEGRSRVEHSPFQLIVHEDADGIRVHTEHGDVTVEDDQAERIRQQAEVVPAAPVVAAAQDPHAKATPLTIRRVMARDNMSCRNCGRTLYLHVHHVVFRSQGGRSEPDNLVALCSPCHAMVHAGLLQLRTDGRGGYQFLDASGAAVRVRFGPRVPAVSDVEPTAPRDLVIRSLRAVRTRRELAPSWGMGRRSQDPPPHDAD
jgi:hypothetical protein